MSKKEEGSQSQLADQESRTQTSISRRLFVKSVAAFVGGTAVGGFRFPHSATAMASENTPQHSEEESEDSKKELESAHTQLDLIKEDIDRIFHRNQDSSEVTISSWFDVAKPYLSEPKVTKRENSQDSRIDVYDVTAVAPIEGEQQLDFAVQVQIFSGGEYPYFAYRYGEQEVCSIWFTTDGKPVSDDPDQLGVVVYYPMNTLPMSKSLEEVIGLHAKHLFPAALQSILDVSAFTKWNQVLHSGSTDLKERFITWLFPPEEDDQQDHAFTGGFVSHDQLPSAHIGWQSDWAEEWRMPGYNENYLVDILTHEAAHGTLLPFGSMQTQECIGQAAGIVQTLKMADQGLVDTTLPYEMLYSTYFSPFRHAGSQRQGVRPGEIIAHYPYDANFFFYLLMQYGRELGIDTEQAYDGENNLKSEVIIELWEHFTEGCYYLRELLSIEEFAETFRSVYERDATQSYQYISDAVGDRSIILAILAYQLKMQGSRDLEAAIQQVVSTSLSPLDSHITSYILRVFNPTLQEGTAQISQQITNYLWQRIPVESDGEDTSDVEIKNDADVEMAVIDTSDDVFDFVLAQRSKKIEGSKYPNSGYQILKCFNLGPLQQRLNTDQLIELRKTDEAEKVHISIRNESGRFYAEFDDQENLLLPVTDEEYYVLIAEKESNFSQLELIRPLEWKVIDVVQEEESVPDGTDQLIPFVKNDAMM